MRSNCFEIPGFLPRHLHWWYKSKGEKLFLFRHKSDNQFPTTPKGAQGFPYVCILIVKKTQETEQGSFAGDCRCCRCEAFLTSLTLQHWPHCCNVGMHWPCSRHGTVLPKPTVRTVSSSTLALPWVPVQCSHENMTDRWIMVAHISSSKWTQ